MLNPTNRDILKVGEADHGGRGGIGESRRLDAIHLSSSASSLIGIDEVRVVAIVVHYDFDFFDSRNESELENGIANRYCDDTHPDIQAAKGI